MLSHLTRLAFGRARPNGGSVSDTDWQEFERDHLAASFPAGFTVIHASGGWRDAATGVTITEPSVIVEVAQDGSPEAARAIGIVATVYKTIFQQDAVMVTTVPCTVDFI